MILLVEDTELIQELVKDILKEIDLEVDIANDGLEGLEKIHGNKKYNLILVDVMMPNMDGLKFTEEIRRFSNIPIIFVTALSDEKSQALAYDKGADGYIKKPFSPNILISIIRRYLSKIGTTKKYGGLELHYKSRKVILDGDDLLLPTKERELLFYLVDNEGVVRTREQILDSVWGYDYAGTDRVVDKHITKLRTRLERYGEYIKTVKMLGYKFEFKRKNVLDID